MLTGCARALSLLLGGAEWPVHEGLVEAGDCFGALGWDRRLPLEVISSILLPVSCSLLPVSCGSLGVAGAATGLHQTTVSCGSCRTREKILEGWKVYAGTSNLLQLPAAASISQIIINGNYTDEEDDYDIALMRLSKPLTLSGEWIDTGHTHPGSSRRPSGPSLVASVHPSWGSRASARWRSKALRGHLLQHLCFTIEETEAQRLEIRLSQMTHLASQAGDRDKAWILVSIQVHRSNCFMRIY